MTPKFAFGLFLGLNACFISLVMAEECTFDEPGDKDGNPCDGQPLVIPLPTGGSACCSSYGSMSIGTKTVNGQTVTECTCPDSSGSTDGGSSGGSPPEIDIGTFRQQALQRHNSLRAKHGSPPLKLSEDLNTYAQNWAEHLAQTKEFKHSNVELPSGESVGENIATIFGYKGVDYSDGGDPVQNWYDEINDYDYNNPFKPGPATGHFTQVVWKSTTELGIGKARSADGEHVYVVGSYRKPGNMLSLTEYAENVPPLQ